MALHQQVSVGTDEGVATVALQALREARVASDSGSAAYMNADGTYTLLGPANITGATLATHIGDVTPPPKPTGLSTDSSDGKLVIHWDGTLDGDIPSDFDHINIYVTETTDAGATWPVGEMTHAGSITVPFLEAGADYAVYATSEDDACDWRGTPIHNVSEASDLVRVTVGGRAIVSVTDFWAEQELAPDKPTTAEPMAPWQPDLPNSEEGSDSISVWNVKRTVYDDDSFSWSDVVNYTFGTQILRNAYDITLKAESSSISMLGQEIQANTAELEVQAGQIAARVTKEYADGTYASQSSVTQTANSIRSEVSSTYVSQGTSGVTSLGSVMVQTSGGLDVYSTVDGTQSSTHAHIDDDEFSIKDSSGTTLSSFSATKIKLGASSTSSTIDMCNGSFVFQVASNGYSILSPLNSGELVIADGPGTGSVDNLEYIRVYKGDAYNEASVELYSTNKVRAYGRSKIDLVTSEPNKGSGLFVNQRQYNYTYCGAKVVSGSGATWACLFTAAEYRAITAHDFNNQTDFVGVMNGASNVKSPVAIGADYSETSGEVHVNFGAGVSGAYRVCYVIVTPYKAG